MKTREYQYDNIRFLLMALVVLGHLLEIAGEFPHRELLYALIYSFHMPAFLFLSGMFARFDRAKWLFGMALPYLLLQWLYTAFVEKLGDPWVHVQFSRPYWILWYLFVLMVYTLLLPVYDTPSPVKQGLMVAASVALALLAGFDKSVERLPDHCLPALVSAGLLLQTGGGPAGALEGRGADLPGDDPGTCGPLLCGPGVASAAAGRHRKNDAGGLRL